MAQDHMNWALNENRTYTYVGTKWIIHEKYKSLSGPIHFAISIYIYIYIYIYTRSYENAHTSKRQSIHCSLSLYIYIYIYICVCVCVCVYNSLICVIYIYIYIYDSLIYIYHHHDDVMLLARISLTPSRHSSPSSIASRPFILHPVSVQSCCR